MYVANGPVSLTIAVVSCFADGPHVSLDSVVPCTTCVMLNVVVSYTCRPGMWQSTSRCKLALSRRVSL